MMKTIPIGIIGLGHVARAQVEALETADGLSLCAACDIDPDQRSRVPGSIPFFSDPEKFFQFPEMEAVVISVPPDVHLATVEQAMKHDLKVLLEKPMVTTHEELHELTELHKQSGHRIHSSLHAAFGAELLWFADHYPDNLAYPTGELIGFHCGLYDPYIQNGNLLPHAVSLGGSWIDSAINALSILARIIDPSGMSLLKTTQTALPGYECREIGGSALLSFHNSSGRRGMGVIDTNWTLGIDSKSTTLYFEEGTWLLDHSGQSVWYIGGDGSRECLADFSEENERMVSHYSGVFSDFRKSLSENRSNFEMSYNLHNLMLSYYSSEHTNGSP